MIIYHPHPQHDMILHQHQPVNHLLCLWWETLLGLGTWWVNIEATSRCMLALSVVGSLSKRGCLEEPIDMVRQPFHLFSNEWIKLYTLARGLVTHWPKTVNKHFPDILPHPIMESLPAKLKMICHSYSYPKINWFLKNSYQLPVGVKNGGFLRMPMTLCS